MLGFELPEVEENREQPHRCGVEVFLKRRCTHVSNHRFLIFNPEGSVCDISGSVNKNAGKYAVTKTCAAKQNFFSVPFQVNMGEIKQHISLHIDWRELKTTLQTRSVLR